MHRILASYIRTAGLSSLRSSLLALPFSGYTRPPKIVLLVLFFLDLCQFINNFFVSLLLSSMHGANTKWFFSHRQKYWHLLHKTYNMRTYLPSLQVRPLNPAEHKHLSLLSVKPLRQVELFLQGFFAQALWCKNKKNSLNVLVRPIPLSYKSRSFWRCNIVIRLVKSLSFQIHRLLIKIKT